MNAGPGLKAPPGVLLACRLLLLSLALGTVSLAPSISGHWWVSPDSGVPESVALAFCLSFVAAQISLYLLLIYLTYTRRNWARWALLTLLMSGWVLLVGNYSQLQADTPIAALWNAGGMALELVAAYLLFFGRDAGWFSTRRTPPQG